MSTINHTVWFIADAGAGLPAALADAVLASGASVVLAARRPELVHALAARHPQRAHVLALDVTDPASIAAAVADAEARFGRIDVLAASAFHHYPGAIEEGDDGATRTLFDENVFGPINLARRVLPGMRARRAGHVVLLARAPVQAPAGEGFGHAARSALEALAEALFHEVAPLGIGVTLVDADGGAGACSGTGAAIPDYAGLAARRLPRTGGDIDAARAAAAIMQAVAAGRGPLRLVLGRAALQRAYDRLRVLKVGFDAWAELTASADAPDPPAAAAPVRARRPATSAGTNARTMG
jgi:NADP-dependent 3-hydroxy acid dehydrogenase YdfG